MSPLVNVEKTFHFATHSRLPIVSSYQRKVNFRKRSQISYFKETHKISSLWAADAVKISKRVQRTVSAYLKINLTRQSRTIACKLSSWRYAFHNNSLLSAISSISSALARHSECHWTFAFCIFFFPRSVSFLFNNKALEERDGERES